MPTAFSSPGQGDPLALTVPSRLPSVFAAAPPVLGADVAQQLGATAAPTAFADLPGAPASPDVTAAPTPVQQQLAETGARLRKLQDQDANPYGSANNHPGVGGKILHALSVAGNIAGDIFAPSVMENIPGTQANRQVMEGGLTQRLQGLQSQDSEEQLRGAQTANTEADAAYNRQRPALEQQRIDAQRVNLHAKYGQLAAKAGQTMTIDPTTGEPTFADDPTSQAYRDRVALADMHNATADKDKITSEIAQNKYKPGTPEYIDAQRRLAQADQRLQLGIQGLGLRAEGLQLRKENTQASLYGTDLAGNLLPGTPEIMDEEGNVTGVGSKNAGHAIAQQAAVGTFNDLVGSVQNARTKLKAFYAAGGSLSDPQIIAATTDPTSMIGKVINGKLVQGNLNPLQLAGINAVRQLHEQAGILRKTTGGTSAEAGAQRILDTTPTFGDADNMALSKLDEQDGVLGRLTKTQTSVAGGLKVHTPGGGQAGGQEPKGGRGGGAPASLKAGEVRPGNDGNYRFKGGDQYNQKNWEKVP